MVEEKENVAKLTVTLKSFFPERLQIIAKTSHMATLNFL